ncbi:thioredoxin-like protein [Podospora appendiculata]|uniref:Thioredoxin-like protein n=1 Tax=Podospora appendiculata TaxID=314037 RepID=A0AAE0XLW5_9PEZI|nr:thioredoxin-like protein [Podospora appendiculata]
MSSQDAKLILYTNHLCPWAHRAHIALSELGLDFEEVIIDLGAPRTPEYLKINPRGLVPALSYNGEIIIESAIVSNFLADLVPGKLLPASNTPSGALARARSALFVDAFLSKFQPALFKLFTASTDAEKDEIIETAVGSVVKEVEPRLADANPFFGGSATITQAEVLTGSFVVRLAAYTRAGFYPPSFTKALEERAPNFTKWADAVSKHPSVTGIFDEPVIVESTKARFDKIKVQAATK